MSFNATTSKFSDYVRGLPAASEADLAAGNNMPIVSASEVKKMGGENVAKAAEVDGVRVFEGIFSSGQAINIPISNVVDEQYEVEVETSATLFSIYFFVDGVSGSGRQIQPNEIAEYTDADRLAGRNCIRVYFNEASSSSAKIYVRKLNAGVAKAVAQNNSHIESDISANGKSSKFKQLYLYEVNENNGLAPSYNSTTKILTIPPQKVSFGGLAYASIGEKTLDLSAVTESNVVEIYYEIGNANTYVLKGLPSYSSSAVSYDYTNRYYLGLVHKLNGIIYMNSKFYVNDGEMKFGEINRSFVDSVKASVIFCPYVGQAFLNENGTTTGSGIRGVSDYIDISFYASIEVSKAVAIANAAKVFLCWYNADKTCIGNEKYSTISGASEDVDGLKVNVPSGAKYCRITLSSYSVAAEIVNANDLNHRVEKIERNTLVGGRSLGVLGASYCTYAGWLPEGQAPYYPASTHPDVNDVSVCWWYKVMEQMGWTLHYNDAWSGSTISNSVRSGMPLNSSMVQRAEVSFGSGKVLNPKPSVILLCGGINDGSIGTEVGECKYDGWTDEDLLKVAPALCKTLYTLKKYNPGAMIINVSCNVTNDIDAAMVEACNHYGVKYIKVTGISGALVISGHPNAAGHAEITRQIVAALKE